MAAIADELEPANGTNVTSPSKEYNCMHLYGSSLVNYSNRLCFFDFHNETDSTIVDKQNFTGCVV